MVDVESSPHPVEVDTGVSDVPHPPEDVEIMVAVGLVDDSLPHPPAEDTFEAELLLDSGAPHPPDEDVVGSSSHEEPLSVTEELIVVEDGSLLVP